MEGKIHALIVAFHRPYPRSTVGVAFGADDVLLATTTADKGVQVKETYSLDLALPSQTQEDERRCPSMKKKTDIYAFICTPESELCLRRENRRRHHPGNLRHSTANSTMNMPYAIPAPRVGVRHKAGR